MFREDVTKLFTDVILDPYSLKDLRLLIAMARQDFINTVLSLRTLQLAKQELNPFSWIKASRINRALLSTLSEIRKKRLLLDDLERALEVAANNDHGEMEKRAFYQHALEEAEREDEERYQKRLERLEKEIESKVNRVSEARFLEVPLLIEIKKQIAEMFLFLERNNYQDKRKSEWELYGPPSNVRQDYEKAK